MSISTPKISYDLFYSHRPYFSVFCLSFRAVNNTGKKYWQYQYQYLLIKVLAIPIPILFLKSIAIPIPILYQYFSISKFVFNPINSGVAIGGSAGSRNRGPRPLGAPDP